MFRAPDVIGYRIVATDAGQFDIKLFSSLIRHGDVQLWALSTDVKSVTDKSQTPSERRTDKRTDKHWV